MDEKRIVIIHILYEFQVYLYTYNRIKFGYLHQLDFNCCWISHNVSLRNIINFFRRSDGKHDDMTYYNFMLGDALAFEKYPFDEKEVNDISNEIVSIHRGICHISESRFNYDINSLDDLNIKLIDKSIIIVRKLITLFLNLIEKERSNIGYQTTKNHKYIDLTNQFNDDKIDKTIIVINDLMRMEIYK